MRNCLNIWHRVHLWWVLPHETMNAISKKKR